MDRETQLTANADDAGKRLDLFLQQRLPQYSRARLQTWIKAGRVTVAGAAAKPSSLLRGGEHIAVNPADLPPLRAFPEDLPLALLYEDPEVIAVDKPAGMVVHMGAGNHSGTVVNALLHRFAALSTTGGADRPGIVHRLDRDTSGVLLVARSDASHRALAAQFAAREVHKTYLALVQGAPAQAQGRIATPIERDPIRRTRMTTRTGKGRSALTTFSVLRRWDKCALLEVRIHTGRTHQIRVHLASIHHPVVGDRLYGAAPSPLGRFFLHAHRISFRSPATGEMVTVSSPLPPDLENFLNNLP